MSTRAKIHAAKVDAAEREAIAGIPKWLADNMAKADAEFKKRGGCPGCGSQVIGVHHGDCTELAKHPFD